MISVMNDPQRYQRDFDDLMQDAQLRAQWAEHLQGVERLEQLFAAANAVGIDQSAAWKIIERHPNNSKSGVLLLIEEVRKRSN